MQTDDKNLNNTSAFAMFEIYIYMGITLHVFIYGIIFIAISFQYYKPLIIFKTTNFIKACLNLHSDIT